MSKRRVEVTPYQEQWTRLFASEAEELKKIFGLQLVQIHHIGSTSIPGMAAKPVIDIMIEVSDINEVDRYNLEMESLGYEPKGENGIPERRYFQKGGNERSHHVHIYQTGNEQIDRHLQFRDYMIAHPEDAKQYSELKTSLAKQFPESIDDYIEGKDAFVKEMDRKASEWKETTK